MTMSLKKVAPLAKPKRKPLPEPPKPKPRKKRKPLRDERRPIQG